MNWSTAIFLIVAMVCLASVLRGRGQLRGRRRDNRYENVDTSSENAQLKDEIKVLKERISVLERLATDDQRSIELDREIAKLRDQTKV